MCSQVFINDIAASLQCLSLKIVAFYVNSVHEVRVEKLDRAKLEEAPKAPPASAELLTTNGQLGSATNPRVDVTVNIANPSGTGIGVAQGYIPSLFAHL